MRSEKRSERRSFQMSRSFRFELGLSLNHPGVAGAGHELSQRQATSSTVGFEIPDIPLGFDSRYFALDVDYLSHRLNE